MRLFEKTKSDSCSMIPEPSVQSSQSSVDISREGSTKNGSICFPAAVKIIFIYHPQIRIQKVKVCINRPIQNLYKIYSDDKIFLFNGMILSRDKTFTDYGINESSKLVILSKHNKEMVERWLRLTSDIDEFNERVNMKLNNECSNEFARLNDIRFDKLEMKNRRFKRNFSQQIPDISQFAVKNVPLKINFINPDEPSEEPLPVIW